MERPDLQRRLDEARRSLALAERHVARQRELLAELERYGHAETAERARDLLRVFEDTLAAHRRARERIAREVAAEQSGGQAGAALSAKGE